ncbi:MAG: SUMF1/EgtB/PvdO family nonheme iron enzyme, partial [Planctomycetota bacterium]
MSSGRFPSGPNRVIRGGSWNNNSNNCRSANRNNNNPSNTNNNNGFRVVCAPAHTVARSVSVRTGGRSRSAAAT